MTAACGFVFGALLLALTGCGDDTGSNGDGGTSTDTSTPQDGPGVTRTYLISLLDVGKPDPADMDVVPGFDLDGTDNRPAAAGGEGKSPESCNQDDYTSPAPDEEPGVDNQLGIVLGLLGGAIDVSGAIEETLLNSELLLVITVAGIHDFTNDSEVEVTISQGLLPAGVTMLANNGTSIDPGQTVTVDPAGRDIVVQGSISNGRLRGGPVSLSLENLMLGDSTLSFDITKAQVRFDITESSLSNGVVGGQLDVQELITNVTAVAGDMIDPSLITTALGGQADLDANGGTCSAISVALVFDAVDVVIGG